MKKYWLASLLALLWIPAFSQVTEPTFSFYSSAVDAINRTVTFNIGFTAEQNFNLDDGYGLPQDSFQLWVDPDAGSAIDRAQGHVIGWLNNSRQTILSMRSYLNTGLLDAVTVQSPDYMGPRSPDGWGSAAGSFALSITPDHAAHVTVPFSVLQTNNGHCFYSLMVLHEGSVQYRVLDGVTDVLYTAPFPEPVPEPSTWAMAGAGLLLLAFLRKRLI
jgi:hypothetical protein